MSFHGTRQTSPSTTQPQERSRQQQDSCSIGTETGRVAVGLYGGDDRVEWGKEGVLGRFGKTVEVGLLGTNYYL